MRWLLRIAATLVLLAGLAIGAVALVPAERIAGLVTQEVSARTGRDFYILGKVRPVFFPVLGVRVNDIRFGNAEWSRSETMLSAESLRIGVEAMALLRGDIRIREFRLKNPVLTLERSASGRGNWELAALSDGADSTGGDGATAPAFTLADGQITGASVTYLDHASGKVTRLDGLDLALSLPESDGPLNLSGALRLGGEKITFSGGVGTLGGLLAGATGDVELTLATDFARLKARGRAGLSPLGAVLDLKAETGDLSRTLALSGATSPLPAKTASFGGQLTVTGSEAVFLREGTLALDDQRLNFDLDLAIGARPKLTARIKAERLDLSGLGGGEASDAAPSEGWSDAPLDLSALHLLDADIGLTAQSVDFGPVRLDATAIRARLDRGRLVVGLNGVSAYRGKMSGEYVINARGSLSMGGDLSVSALQLLPFLSDIADYDRLDAAASGRLKFLTSGNSMAALMRGMSGSGQLDIGAGELIGLDIAGMLRNLDASYRGEGSKTIFESISGSFTIADGVLRNDDLKFTSPLVLASGAGETDLADATVTYRLTPTAFGGRNLSDAGGISVPVLISGRWSDLKFRPDLERIFDAGLAEQRAEAEAKIRADLERAKQEAEEKLRGEAERAVREGVEKTLGDALKRALGQE